MLITGPTPYQIHQNPSYRPPPRDTDSTVSNLDLGAGQGCTMDVGQLDVAKHAGLDATHPASGSVCAYDMSGRALVPCGKQGGKGAKEAVQAPQEVQEWDIEPFVTQMGEALDHLRRKLAGIRTGRASPGLLEAVSVEARSSGSSHGPHVPLRVLGTVVARGPQLLVDDKAVAKAIQNSPLKLQARAENGEVLVPVPRLSLEMVKGFVKLAAQEAEAARKAVRAVRHRALEQAKLCNTGGPAGELKRMEQQVQALTDKHIREVDGLLRAKERDLQEHH
eukprot:XP_001703044.1 predicted protein [Chlamydomonas reinhardtii]